MCHLESNDNDGLLLEMDDDLFPVDEETEATECGSNTTRTRSV